MKNSGWEEFCVGRKLPPLNVVRGARTGSADLAVERLKVSIQMGVCVWENCSKVVLLPFNLPQACFFFFKKTKQKKTAHRGQPSAHVQRLDTSSSYC